MSGERPRLAGAVKRTGQRLPGLALLLLAAAGLVAASAADEDNLHPVVRVGSKLDTESVILGELVRQLATDAGATAVHRSELGGTQIVWKALLNREIDIYPDYTGTLTEEILAGRGLRGEEELRDVLLREFGIRMSRPLGFNNTYALGILAEPHPASAEAVDPRRWDELRRISDLRNFPALRLGFSNEFLDRADGWPRLREIYRLLQTSVHGMSHDLAYRGLESGATDVVEVYSTDAEIAYYGLRILEDDLNVFPEYKAVLLYRDDLRARAPDVVESVLRLEGALFEEQMVKLNARAKVDQVPESIVAADFLNREFGVVATIARETLWSRLLKYTLEHLWLVGISATAAILVAVPLGVLAATNRWLGQSVLSVAGLFQTIPSIALFVLLIPLLGIGAKPAICALFLYSLLPIIRNTYAGLHDIPRSVHESAEALGLPPLARLRLIELPLASRSILAGIKTAVVINVGTATLGGFISAGGYGEPILRGIRKDSTALLMEGAIPAAAMALLAQALFELVERWMVPRGLRMGKRTA